MQSLEAAYEDSDLQHVHKKLKTSRCALPLPRPQDTEGVDHPSTSTKRSCSIFKRFLDLYEQERLEDPNSASTGLKRDSLILEKLVAREKLNTMILNLYPGNKGYSLMFRQYSRTDQSSDDPDNMIESNGWPYTEETLLNYVDNEQIPPYLIDKLELHYSFLFYDGCIIAEVRDYRRAYPAVKCDIHHVLLRPTMQSILADIDIISRDRVDWGEKEKLQLESKMLIARTPALCLKLDRSLCTFQSKIDHKLHMWNTHRLRKTARKLSQVAVNRKKIRDRYTHHHGLELFNFILKNKSKTAHNTRTLNRLHEEIPVPIPNLDVPVLIPPQKGVHINSFKMYERPEMSKNCSPELVEEYVLETDIPLHDERSKRVYHIRLSILQRPLNFEYLGELYLEWGHKDKEQNGVACRFSLGTKAHANKYIQQFTDIFTDNFRKRVNIRHRSYKEKIAAQAQTMQLTANPVHSVQEDLAHVAQNQPRIAPLVNGTIAGGINMIQQNRSIQNASNVPILQAQLQSKQQFATKDLDMNTNTRRISAQDFQTAENVKQQPRVATSGNNTAIINLLNRLPVSSINNDANITVVSAPNNTSFQVALNQKPRARKMTVSNVANARVLNHGNLIAVNNNRMSVSDFNTHLNQQNQPQTITISSAGSGNTFGHASYTLKQPHVLSSNANEESALSTLLVSTAAADRPDIVGSSTNSLVLEKLAGLPGSAASSGTQNFMQSSKSAASAQPQAANPVCFAPIQSISGLQNMQVQLPLQTISLLTGPIQGQPGLFVSLPVTTATATCTVVNQQTSNSTVTAGSAIGVGAPTVVFGNNASSDLAHLVSSGMKGSGQQGLRAAGSAGITLSQGGQQIQLKAPIQKGRRQQSGIQQNITARGLQTTPITIKVASPNATTAQVMLPSNTLTSQLQKQAQFQQYQQLYLNQQQKNLQTNIAAGRIRRRSNATEPQ